MRLIDADDIYPWYIDAFDFDPNEVRFSMNDIRENLDNIPTHSTPSNTLGTLDCVSREDLTKGIEKYFGDLPITVHYDMLALAQKLPSAQPDIIRCRNCKFASGDSRICMKFGHSPIGELDFCAWAERRTDEE